ncbi:hypothetical protein [Rhodohalobacter mucosus]|uniref:Uncharacterized protein n=1 Tax=Rhodohalobacter mucosus TaxID=2079485 RepID=A0A316TT60_9BACT|nr:hypothetical protein [Rhodohalobacter mucosus]PWN07600.1 hypothetical protein DDZ15_04910 [Rhodohalobacter mucosus]
MAKPTITTLLSCVALFFAAAACGPSLVLQNVDYAQPIESVLTPDSNNQVHDQRYAIKFTITDILSEEEISSVDQIRLIRNSAGYYFVTAPGFSNVYVFETSESELKLSTRISVSDSGLDQPAFNQRNTHIELVDLSTGNTYNLDQNGLR